MPVGHLVHDPILITLIAASLASVAIILDRVFVLRCAARADREFASRGAQDGAPTSALGRLAAEARAGEGSSHEHLATVMETAMARERELLEGPLPVLGVIGSTAVYVGLLGAVMGIIRAFRDIQAHNNMSPSIVAGGIATALVATAAGLAVAIPAVAAHHLIVVAINRRVWEWERVVAKWLPGRCETEAADESHSLA